MLANLVSASFLLAGFISAAVVELGANLEAVVSSGQPLLVQFYAPWCGHCQQMAPTWAEVGESKKLPGVIVGKLDCTAFQSQAQKYGIRGFPTVKFFRKGRGIDYEGPRTVEKITAFALEMLGPAVKTNLPSLSSLVNSKPEPPVFVHLGMRGELYGNFEHLAELYMPKFSFYHVDAPHAGKVAVAKDGKLIDYDETKELGEWIHSEKESSFAEFNLKLAKRFLNQKFIVVAVDKVDGSDKTITVEQVALSRSPALSDFVFTNGYTSMAQRSIDHLTYREAEEGDIVVLPKDAHDGFYFLTKGPISDADFQIFLNQVKSGNAELLGKSAFSRFVWDFVGGFMRLFKENPVLGGLIVGVPSLLIGFVIFGICSIPEGEYEDYSESGSEGDISSNENDEEEEEDNAQRASVRNRHKKRLPSASGDGDETAETSKNK